MIARLVGWIPEIGRLDAAIGALTRVGATADNDIIVAVKGIAACHARIVEQGDGYWVEDAGSGGGTFLNGDRVTRARLHHLDVLTLATSAELVFLQRDDAPAAVAPAYPPKPHGRRRTEEEPPLEIIRRPPSAPPTMTGEGTLLGARFSGTRPVLEDGTSATPGLGTILSPATSQHVPQFEQTIAPALPTSMPSSLAAKPAGGRIVLVRLTGAAGVFSIPIGTATIGRSSEACIRIDTREMSRIHAVLTVTEQSATIEDRGSANGTSVNGSAVSGPHPLTDGDRVSFAGIELRVELERSEG